MECHPGLGLQGRFQSWVDDSRPLLDTDDSAPMVVIEDSGQSTLQRLTFWLMTECVNELVGGQSRFQ